MATDADTAQLYEKFVPQDEPFDNHRRVENRDEWGVHGTIDGKPATIYYLFTDKELKDAHYPKLPFSLSRVIEIQFIEDQDSNA